MRSHFNGRHRSRLTLLVLGGLFYSSVASAANLVSTIPSDYGNSEMGTVTGSRVTTQVDADPQVGVLKNLNRDPASFGFHQKGRSMILLRQYTYSTTELEGTKLIDPNSAGAAASMASGKTTAVPNMHAAAASDEYIYMTGYDLGQIGVVHQSGNRLMENKTAVVNLKNDIKQYCGYNFTETFENLDEDEHGVTGKTYTGDPTKAVVHGEALLVEGRRLYVAASVNPLGGYDPYDDGFLMQYDIQDDGSLKFGSYTRISRNIDQGRLNKFNDHILISCIGGYQHYNGSGNTHYTALNIAKIDQNTGRILGTEQRRASIPEHVKGTGEDMRDLKILPNGTAYVMTYNLSPSGSQINAHVYQTTMSNLMSEHPDDWTEIAVAHEQEGWFGKLNAEYYTKRLWLELGDTLQAYTDGDDAAKHIWQAKDFSENKAFSRFNKITMIEPDWVYGNTASVVMTLPAELGGTTTAAALNENAVWKDNAVYTDTVTTRQSWDGDTVVSIGKDKLGDKSTNVLAAISATGGKRLNISAKNNLLQLQVENTVGNPTGIYARGADLTVSAAKGINIFTRGLDGGNTLTNAVQLDAMKDKAVQLTINGPLSISMTGGLGGNGVAIQKSDRQGEKSYEASVASGIRINGNLKIAGAHTNEWGIPLNRENVFSRFNNAGILTQVEKSNVTVNGDVDMTVYGNGVTTNAKDSSVRIAGGGSIQVPAAMKYSYYALAAYQGAISMNMGDDGTKPGNGKKINEIADVKLDGDLFALPTGRLDVALMTDKSYLHGLVDNGGTANLYLQNGAQWLNEGRNARYYQDDEDMGAGTMAAVKTRAGGTVGKFYNAQSRVTNFVGGTTEAQRGIIYQKSINPLMIENYSGHTAAVYTHDAAAPTSFKGGDIVINKATGAENVFTLFTDGAGVTTGNQSAVLNALANKLTYKSFAENKLLGKLSIGESLTTSSISGQITFGNEKGSYTGGATPPPPPIGEQTKTEFTSQLTQKEVAEYKAANVEPSPGNYKFTKDTTIRRSSYDGIIAATTYPKQPLNVDAREHKLTLIGDGSNFILGVDNNSKDGIKITADTLKIDVKSSDGRAFGIRNNQDGSVVTIKGDLDIKAQSSQTAQGLVTSRGAAIEADGLHVELNKDSADGAWAISNSNGKVTVNSDGSHEVVINGNVQTGEEGNTNISLTTGQSVLNGVIQKVAPSGGEDEDEEEYGGFSLPLRGPAQNGAAKGNALTLQNGAVWTNEDYNTQKSALIAAKFTGSQLFSLKGGDDAAHAGAIFQRDSKDIMIDNYSGHTRVFYAHDAAAPTTIKGGALKIGKASADSSITLTTDNSGLNTEAASGADKKLVDDTLNALANKLWYTAYTTGERNLSGKAEIAEGLTASAASKRMENITFDMASGQGSYTPAPPTPPTPPSGEQTKTEFTEQLTQKEVAEYKDANVEPSPGNYEFTKDTTISKTSYAGAISNTGFPKNPLTIDAGGHVLTVKGEGNNGLVTGIKNSGEKGIAIAADTVKINVKSGTGKAYGVWNAKNGSTIKITGNLDISATGGDAAKGLSVSKDAAIETDGLDVTLNKASLDGWSIDNNGTIKVNKGGTHKVILRGNIHSGANGSTDLSLTTAESALNGVVHKEGEAANGVSLLLTNGAVWNNQDWNQSSAVLEKISFAGSHLASLKGGSNASNAGVIFQKNDKDISIDNYSGHTRVFYAHDASAPTTMKGGDFRIKNAAADSAITLTTDSTGLNTESTKAADKNLVSATLNALANKLWYTAYTTNERNLTGKAEIAEGLTTSAASKRIEDITFDGTTGQGSYVYTPQSEVTTDPIKESETLTYDRQALATQPNTKGNRIVSALYTDNTAYDKQHPMVVDMNGHSLHLEANSRNQIASAIHGGSNKSIRIVNSGEEKTLTIKASNTDTRAANGIQTEANAHIYIQGPVTIEDVHTKGYNATAIQTNGTIGSPSDVTIDGDLTVQSVRADRVDTKNKGADDGRNLAALKTTADESKITVKGNVDIQNIKGSVLKTIGADSVIDVGGGTISAAEDADHTKQYHAVHAEKGTVNINTPEGVSGSRKTNITGDMYVTREYGKKTVEYSGGQLVDFESKGVLNVSLTTADSSWTGAATYDVNRADFQKGGFTAHDVGQFNLTLQNGARWTNELKSSVTDKWLGSHLASLKGGSNASNRGVIFQKTDKDISIDNYSGHTRVFYAHDASAPTTMKGGDFRIKNAAADSAITLTTDSTGLNTESTKAADKNLVSATLNALANKLWYTAYTTGERNLTGKAEIAEGLTTSAASKRIEDITFSETNGQGSYVYTPAVDPPPSTEQTKTEFTKRLFGTTSDQEYIDAHVRQEDGTYQFTKDSTITYQNASDMNRGAIKPNVDVDIDATDRVLTVKSGGRAANVKESAAIANDGKALDIKAKTLRLLVNDTTSVAPLQSAWGIRTTGNSETNISGMTEIDVGGTKSSKAVQAFGGTVTLEGLSAKTNAASEDAAALFAQNDGHIRVNMKGSNPGDSAVALDGNIAAKDAASRVEVGLRGEASHFKGLAYGDGTINMWLQKDAVWQNGKQGALLPTGFTGSHISRFVGGPSSDRAGAIFQNDDKNITIDTYHGYTKVFFAHDSVTPTNIKGGDIVIGKALGGSSITLITDNAGLNMEASAATAEKNLVSATLNSLANKLWYTAYTTGERSLAGKVQIAEGLTTSAASKRIGDITFDETTGRGGYIYTPLIDPPASQTDTDFTTAITGDETHDIPYTNAGVRKADGKYIFTKDSTITTGKDLIAAGAWMSNISAAVSNASTGKTLDINLNGKNLAIKTVTDVSTTGISAIGKDSKVNIKNAGAISIDAESTNYGQTATLFVNGGGAIHIENGGSDLENKVLKVRANGNHKTNVAVIKSMNGVTGVESNITIDGLVDVLADGNDAANGKGANEAVSAVASTIDIGGGSIRAINGAWAAIRAYGEFVSDNYGTVNFNVTKGADGLANGAGMNRAVVEGDIVTNGGMGTKGRVSVGLSTADSHWIGNYADTRGYGVTPGQLGAVNLFMKNGSYWKGFSNGSMKVEMSGEGTNWTGFNVGDNMQLKLSDGAIWHNAITQEQKDQDNKPVSSKVKYFTGSGGFIDMTGTNRFLASSNSLSGAPVQTGSSSIEEKGLGETGDLTIDEFNGSTTMLYRHDALSPTTIYGGKLTIGKAAAGSLVKMVTDSVGLNTESTKAADKNLVSATLNALANKLWYTAYTTGERNLTGKAEIAEGLTTSAASKRIEDITFDGTSGQGRYVYTPAVDPPPSTEQTKTEFTTRLRGVDEDQEYIDANVRQADGTYRFTKDSTITYQNDQGGLRSTIIPNEDVHIDATDRVLTIKNGSGIASVTQGAAIANSGKTLDIKAKTLKLLVNDTTSVAPLQTAWGIMSTGGTTNISGMTEIDVAGTERSKAIQAYGGTVTLEGLRAKANAASKDAVTLDVQGGGRINVNVKDGTVGSSEVMLDGNITARESGSRVDAALTTGTSYLKGLISGVGTLNLWLQNGAAWHNEEYTAQPTGFSSRLSNLTGGSNASNAGVIFQKNANDVTIDNYSGHARVFYEHDAATPTTIKGGDFRIKNAATGSAITLTTDNVGLNTESTKAADKNLVSATLNALANKLWYTAYTTGERNLTGKAEIAEGLTTSAASKRIEDITFNETTGQGGYTYTPAVDPPQPPQPGQDEQTTTAFTTPITGDAAVDTDYVTAHVLKDDKYTFTKNSKITAATGIQAVQDKPVTVQAAGAELKIQAADYGVDAGTNSKVAITGKQLTIDAGSRSIRAAANSDISVGAGFDLKGAIENNGGRISLNDTGRKSSLVGDITQTSGNFNLRMQGLDSKLNSKIVASDGVFDLSMEGAGATFTGSIRGSGSAREAGTGERRLTLEDKTIWNVTAPSNLTRLNAKQGSIINYLFSNDEGVNIENFKGAATVHYDGAATADGTLTLTHTGKFRIRNVEGTGNALTIATDASAGSDAADEKVATSLAKQFEYIGDRNNIQDRRIQGLSLSALIADGMMSSAKRYAILLGTDGTSEGVKPFVSNVEYGDYETMIMQSTKGAMTSSAMVWRNEMNDLMKRMGDLRLSPGDLGGWVRFYKGRTSSDKDKASFRMNYTTIQAGYDWKAGKDWRVGIAGSYMKGSSNYATGSGDNKAGNFAVYGTWTGKSGQYVDLIAKVGRVANEFRGTNAWGNVEASGDYHAWGESVSAEYGRRFKTDGSFYFEPQVEFTFGRLNGVDYDMQSNGYGTLKVRQSGMNSAIGRLGVAFGQEMEKATWFVKASLYHEFAGDMDTTWEVAGSPTKYTQQKGKDTWLGLQLGGTVKLNDRLSLYGDFEKTFSGDIKTDWRVDAGLRWSF